MLFYQQMMRSKCNLPFTQEKKEDYTGFNSDVVRTYLFTAKPFHLACLEDITLALTGPARGFK
jgi:hypothetical protein